jgi:hypothetical protein
LITRYRSDYNVVNSIHFHNAICLKIATTNEVVSSCWQKVIEIPLKEQLQHSYYFEAKMEEFKHLGYAFDKDLEVINADAGNTLLREWIESEYKFRVKLESKKLVQDELKFFESLSLQAKLTAIWSYVSVGKQ